MKNIPAGSVPLIEMLEKYSSSKMSRFHMPGHKGKFSFLSGDIVKFDITELDFSDNLLNPRGVIEEAQILFAKLFNAQYAHFSTNGSTAGVLALTGAAEGTVLTERASHTSVFNALKLFNKKAVVINNEFKNGRFLPVTPEQVRNAVKKNPQIKSVFLTYPNYYGECGNLTEISKICAENNLLLFADSAHGAHFGVNRHLPAHAIKFCDACTVSVHKTLPSFTQSAAVLVNGKTLSEKVKRYLNVFNSSSPNYVLLAGIDYARQALQQNGSTRAKRTFEEIQKLKEANSNLDFAENDDFTRLVIDFSKNNISGETAYGMLCRQGVRAEFFDDRRVVFIVSIFEQKKDIKKLSSALKIFDGMNGNENVENVTFKNGEFSILDFSNASGNVKETELALSEGQIAAESLGIYPPSVPVVLEGEMITAEHILFLQKFSKRLVNVHSGKIMTIES